MSGLIPTCIPNHCPICDDNSSKCRIDEYGYIALCYQRLDAKVGELVGVWLCKRVSNDYSQWKDQRVELEAHYQQIKIEVRITDADGKSVALENIFEKMFERHRKKLEQGGER